MDDIVGGEVLVEGVDAKETDFEVAARSSQAPFSSSNLYSCQYTIVQVTSVFLTYLWISASSSSNVALFFSFCGFGFLIAAGFAISSYYAVSVALADLDCVSYSAEPV